MKGPQFQQDQSLDYLSPSFIPTRNEEWINTGIELEAKEIAQSPAYLCDYPSRADSSEWKRQSLDLLTKEYATSQSSSNRTSINNQCCAFQRLEDLLQNPGSKQDNLSRKGPCHRLISWVAICRDSDPDIDCHIKRSCPLAKCTFSCDPDDGELIRHILSCSFLKYGKYKCPYHNNEVEAFMIPQQRRLRKRWNRAHSLREAFRDICKLGSKGLHKAFGHSNKKRRFDGLETMSITDTGVHAFEIDGQPHIQRKRASTNYDFWPEKRQPPARRSEALQSQIQSQIREADDTTMINELMGEFVSELPGQDLDLYTELSAVRFSAVPQDLPQIVTDFSSTTTQTDTFLPSPLSTTQYVSSDRFESPISPQEVQGVVKWAEAVESSSGHQVSLDAVVFGWPMNQNSTSQAAPSISMARSPNALLRAKGLQTISIDTSVGPNRPVSPPKQADATSPTTQLPSSPENPEVLSYEPSKFFEELRSTVQNTYTFTYAQLSRPPQLAISEEIISRQLTPAKVFSSGWEAVEKVLNGQLPQKFWWLFSLAQLAFACGQVVWESELKHQLDDIVDDLRLWSYALRSPRERQCYLEVVEQIFISEERKTVDGLSRSSSAASRRSHRDSLSMDGQELLTKLRHGAVIRLCLSFLGTFEYLRYRQTRIDNAVVNGFVSLLQTTDTNDHNVAVLDKAVIRPLLARAQFHDLVPVMEKASDLLCDYPSTSIRELELFLVCHSRYYTKDHALYLSFRHTVAECCFDAALQMTGQSENYLIPESYYLQDIAAVHQCYKDLSSTTSHSIESHNPISRSANTQVQELQGSPVSTTPHFQTPHPTLQRLQMDFQSMQPSQRFSTGSHIHTPLSAHIASPSTAASSTAPSLWTPNSAHCISPATATSTTFPSPYTSMCWPNAIAEDTAYTHPNFPLPINNDYDLLANEFLHDDPSLFATEVPIIAVPVAPSTLPSAVGAASVAAAMTETDLSTVPGESKASLSCQICGTTFTGKEQFLASNLRRHMRELHSAATKGLTCEVCKKPFTRKHNLNVHLKTVHADGRF